MSGEVALRAFRDDDLWFLDRANAGAEAFGDFEWTGFVDPHARRRRWEHDGYIGTESSAVAIVLPDDGDVVGLASWKAQNRAGTPVVCYEIGVVLLPEYRGRGLGIAAHRVLVDHLLRYTPVHRLEAWVENGNRAEERTLEKLGFLREGVLREVLFRDGAWRDGVVYGRLRTDAVPDA